ncbi:hypothetical protein E9152_11530 [Klebsiella pneumoniae subsp. pneumoniae]|uniref:hypothetical protein n=1 Tax=Klebsiella pneumoniae TaxID=573 RepID=UPI0010A624D5|nr:hypothetical protein [Klebsiella pneumoniae]THH62805.1 hypothetical protein E9152_11530 [Klebsiella pneumoniae subsp. pneumoniae]THH75938.1 hypothetical protein E9162_13440 [Klebsiella pneumoniae]
MTITLQAVNELIASLENAGELSIIEQKFLKLAKAFKQLAAENVALKSKGKELLGEACAVYSRLNKLIDPSIGDFVDGQTLHEFQFVLDMETPATDAFLDGIKADGVEEFAAKLRIPGDDQFFDALAKGVALAADDFAKQLREGADK